MYKSYRHSHYDYHYDHVDEWW